MKPVRWWWCAAVLVLVLEGTSCTSVSEGDRQLIDQIRQAGIKIVQLTDAVTPALSALAVPTEIREALGQIKAAGSDVTLNSTQLGAALGKPERPVPYSAEASAKFREQSKREHEQGWFGYVLTGGVTLITTLLARGGLTRLLATVAPGFAGGPLGVAATTLVESFARLRRKARARDPGKRHITEADIMAELTARQHDPKVKELLQSLARKAEDKLGIKLSGVLGQSDTENPQGVPSTPPTST